MRLARILGGREQTHLSTVPLQVSGPHGSMLLTMRSSGSASADMGILSPPVSAEEEAVWDTARDVLTGRQFEALEMKHKLGMSYRQIGLRLDITRQAVVDRVKSAERKLAVVLSAS